MGKGDVEGEKRKVGSVEGVARVKALQKSSRTPCIFLSSALLTSTGHTLSATQVLGHQHLQIDDDKDDSINFSDGDVNCISTHFAQAATSWQ